MPTYEICVRLADGTTTTWRVQSFTEALAKEMAMKRLRPWYDRSMNLGVVLSSMQVR